MEPGEDRPAIGSDAGTGVVRGPALALVRDRPCVASRDSRTALIATDPTDKSAVIAGFAEVEKPTGARDFLSCTPPLSLPTRIPAAGGESVRE